MKVTLGIVEGAVVAAAVVAGFLAWSHEAYEYHHSLAHELYKVQQVPQGGQVVSLSRGKVFYRIDGESNGGRLVVLVHGFIGSHMDYEPLARYLVETGKRRVLRMDNYGRGWSSLPSTKTSMTPDLFAGQLAELLFLLGEQGTIDLVGYSMGGSIATTFAEKFGTRKVATLGLIAPAGLPSMNMTIQPWKQKALDVFMRLPFGETIALSLAKKHLAETATREQLNWRTTNAEIHSWYEEYYQERLASEPALAKAMLDTLRSFPFSLHEAYEGLAQSGVPTAALWADEDELVPISSADELRALFSSCPHMLHEKVFQGRSHILAVEDAQAVGEELQFFWNKHN